MSTSTVGDYASFVDWRVSPAVESGVQDSETKTLLAYAIDWYGSPYIRLGFVSRTGPGAFSFSPVGWISPTGITGCGASDNNNLTSNIALAFDSNRGQWGVGIMCTGFTWTAQLIRVTWTGTMTNAFQAHAGVDAGDAHSPIQLAYNRNTERYMFGFSHNDAFIHMGSGTPSCVRSGSNCQQWFPDGYYRGSYWAIAVDYWGPRWEFRFGSTAGTTGESFEFDPLSSPPTWNAEPGDVWLSTPSGWARHVVSYVRDPDGRTVSIQHIKTKSTSLLGELRYTFADEPSSPAAYE